MRVVLAVLAVMLSFLLWPAMAWSAVDITSATLDGVTSTSSPPGGVMEVRVRVNVTGGSTWRSTRATSGATTRCVDNQNEGSGEHSEGEDITAPGTPGNYPITFTVYENDNCSGTPADTLTLDNALRVTAPRANPNLPPSCGGDVLLVLDESGSIESAGATEDVRDATRAFVDGLSGTGSQVSIVDFSSRAQRPVPYTTVTPESVAGVFEPYIRSGYDPGGSTNWEAAFQQARQANAQGPLADLIVFLTDGDPTAMNGPGGDPVTGLEEGDVEAMRRAAVEADFVKGQGSHVVALGVGEAVTQPRSARRLTAVSGFDELPPAGLASADYTLVRDFDALAAQLRAARFGAVLVLGHDHQARRRRLGLRTGARVALHDQRAGGGRLRLDPARAAAADWRALGQDQRQRDGHLPLAPGQPAGGEPGDGDRTTALGLCLRGRAL